MAELDTVSIVTPEGTTDEVLKITNASTVNYRLADVISMAGQYTFSVWAKSDATMNVEFRVLGNVYTESITTAWKKVVFTVDESSTTYIDICPAADTALYLYKGMLQQGQFDTDWKPAPEDTAGKSDLTALSDRMSTVEQTAEGIRASVLSAYENMQHDYCVNGDFSDEDDYFNGWGRSNTTQIIHTTFGGKSCAQITTTASSRTYYLTNRVFYDAEVLERNQPIKVRFKAACAAGCEDEAVVRLIFAGETQLTEAGALTTSFQTFEFDYEDMEVEMDAHLCLHFYNHSFNTTIYITDVEILGYATYYAKTTLSVLADSITSKVWKSDIAEATIGENLIPYPYYYSSGTVSNGVTFTVNDDGSVSTSGTATTGTPIFYMMYNQTLAAGTYTISGCPSGGSSTTYGIRVYRHVGATTLVSDYGSGSTFTLDEATSIRIGIRLSPQLDYSGLTFYPMLEAGSIARSYQPYSLSREVLISTLTQTADSITAEVTRATAAEAELKASIQINADNITSCVTVGNVGSYITQYYNNVLVAFNNSSKYVQISAGAISIYNGTVDDNGLMSAFNSTGEHFYRDGYYVGKIGTNSWVDDNTHKGLVFDLEAQGKYMAWAYKKTSSDTTYSTVLTFSRADSIYEELGLHLGCDLYAENHYIYNAKLDSANLTNSKANGYAVIDGMAVPVVTSISSNSSGTISWTTGSIRVRNGMITYVPSASTSI